MKSERKQLAEIVIPEYERVIREGKKDSFSRFLRRLNKEHMDEGICYYTCFNGFYFGKRLLNYVRSFYRVNDIFWAKIPRLASSKKEAVECLQIRVDILRNHFLNKP